MLATEHSSPIPAYAFIPPNETADGANRCNWMTFLASEWLVRETARLLGISIIGLGRLIGLPDPHKISHWANGHYRPSPVYATRIHELALLQLAGYDVAFIRYINWETGEISWEDGYRGKRTIE